MPNRPPTRSDTDPLRAWIGRALDEVMAREQRGTAGSPSERAASPLDQPIGATGTAAQTIAVGADHGGFALKERLIALLRERGCSVADCGTYSTDSCDYPDFAHEVARRVSDGSCRWGLIVDGAGIGSSMVANKVPGVRAALCYDVSSARNSREHNHANVLTLGASLIGEGLARQIVETWLDTPWGEGRHARRVDKITEVERRYLNSGR